MRPSTQMCPAAVHAATLSASEGLNGGRVHDITEDEVNELCKGLAEGGSTIKRKTIKDYIRAMFGHLSQDARLDILEHFGIDESEGKSPETVPAEEVKDAILSSSFKSFLSNELNDVESTSVDRKTLVSVLGKMETNNDALATLPVTFIYLLAFIALVSGHLRVYSRQRLQQSVEMWVQGYGDYAGPFIERDVFDVATFWSWLDKSGVNAVLGESRNMSGVEVPRIACATDIIGDIAISRTIGDKVDKKYLLKDSPLMSGSLTERAKATVRDLRTGVWKDSRDIKKLVMTWTAYNSRVKMFVYTDVQLSVSLHGTSYGKVMATSVLPSADITAGLVIADIIFTGILLFMTVSELRDICRSLSYGLQAFLDHWEIWNLVDFASIMMGWILVGLWIWCVVLMQAGEISSICDDEGNLKTTATSLSISSLDALLSNLININLVFLYLQVVMAINSLTIGFRLFKAFQANGRLRVVTDTFLLAYTDIVHFLMVFLTILVSFAVIGHVLFGNDLVEFDSLHASISSSFIVLMGEFEWYVETSMDASPYLSSGIPRFCVNIWFWSFMILISLVMLNMLLAIILDKHAVVTEATEALGSFLPTIWSQLLEYVKMKIKTRRYLSISALVAMLENDGHPEERVTRESLQGAFEGMGQEQADWLMSLLKEEARNRLERTIAAIDPCVTPLKRAGRALRIVSTETANAINTLKMNRDRIDRIERRITKMMQQKLDNPTSMYEVGLKGELEPCPSIPVGSSPFSNSKLGGATPVP